MTEQAVWHDLFPPRDEEAEGTRPPVIAAIRVRKVLPTGKYDTHPLPFSPDELTSLADVYAAWGGGQYEFIAIDDNRRVTRRQTERVAGAPKPWPGIIDDPAPTATRPTGGGALPAPSNGIGSGWLAVVGVLGPLALEWVKFQSQAQQAQQQQFQLMMTTLLDRGSAAGREHVEAMGKIYSAMPDLFAKVMSQGAGAGTSEAFFKGLETAQELMAGMRDASGEGELSTDSIMQAVAGFMQAMNQGAPVPGAGMAGMPPPGPSSPPPPGAQEPPGETN